MALEAVLIKQPYEVSFSGNPMPFIWALTPYTINESKQDIRLVVKILLEDNFGSNNFTEVKSQTYYPNFEGKIAIDVRKVIQPYLQFFTPAPNLQKPLQAFEQRKRYRVDYLLQRNQEVLGTVASSNVLYAIKGGISYDQWTPRVFFDVLVTTEHQPLFFEPKRTIHANEPRFLFWTYPFADYFAQTVFVKVNYSDGASSTFTIGKISCGKWGICCTPVGFRQLGLTEVLPGGAMAVSYQIRVYADQSATEIVAWQTYTLEYRNFYQPQILVFRTSLGSLESITLRGQIDFEADYERQNIQLTTPPDYLKDMILKAQANDVNNFETPKYKGDTGFLSKEATDRLRDFFISVQKFEFLPSQDGGPDMLVPITLEMKNTKLFTNKENLITTVIEWKRGYANEFYTPKNAVPPVKQYCPAVENLQAFQINKNTLQIIWSVEIPYEKLEITITTSQGDETFVLTGNSGSITRPFNNPFLITGEDEVIHLIGKTICDENSNPPDKGPAYTIGIHVTGNSEPVPIPDHYNLNVGFNTAQLLTPSPLANDYDPDGDPFEAVPVATGTTDAGGTFSLEADGTLYYLPPSSVFVGDDHFEYEIFETPSGDPVPGDIYVHIGGILGNIYGKVVQRNMQSSGSGYENTTYGEVWLDFFSDPSGSVPVDVTSLNITFNVNQHFAATHLDGTTEAEDTPMPVIGVGTKIKIWEGILAYSLYDSAYDWPEQYSYTHTLQPGTGYIAI